MPRKRWSEEQIIYAVKQSEAGEKAADICREPLARLGQRIIGVQVNRPRAGPVWISASDRAVAQRAGG